MTNQRDNLEQAAMIFEQARKLEGTAREAYLDEECNGNASLRLEIQALLEAHVEQGEFLSEPTQHDAGGGRTETLDTEQLDERVGTKIDRYKLLQLIGEGGFGSVYMAEQQEPVRRKVALKIIKLGMDTKQVIARFEAERQALAMMEHPNIARVLDAGATETGRPYFVMELVKGIPITEYCDQYNLGTRQRLDLFMPVCLAVQHAHQKGIIHRDIKPSNVMVTLHDGKPVPKVIDFGIAKATNHRLTEKTVFTEFRQFIGTPAYMSPEQAEMSGLDVDTRTDIYSLGVLLYELLTATTPFDAESLRQAAYGEVQRIIREVDPPKPSTRLSTLSAVELADIAKHRKAEAHALCRLIRGDLDWIVMKALEKDRTLRFETARELATDIEHHLANEPILACPPRATYKFRKFVKRNRVAATAGLTVAAALAVGLTLSMIGFVQASSQRDQAETARDVARLATEQAETDRDRAIDARQEARRQSYVANIIAAGSALSANEIANARRRLEAAPKEFRNWEWGYFDAQMDDSLAIFRHDSSVESVVFSPDGARLATASEDDKTLRLWDASTGKELAVLRGHEDHLHSVAFSPDGKRLASASHDKTVRLWNASTGQELAVLRGHEDAVNLVAFSPDGTRLASTSDDGTVRLWDASTGEGLGILVKHHSQVNWVTFSPDGTRLATVSGSRFSQIGDYAVYIWDASTGAKLVVLRGHEGDVDMVAFSPDGTRLASASDDNTLRLWDASTGQELMVLRHEDDVDAVAFSPDGTRLASGSDDKSVRLWDASTGRELAVFHGHEQDIHEVAFSPDGTRLATASRDQTVRIWDASTREGMTVLWNPRPVQAITFSPDGMRLASASGASAILWDTSTGEKLATLLGHRGYTSAVAFSPDGTRLASAADDLTVRIWDAWTGEEVGVFRGHEAHLEAVAFSPDNTRLASASDDRTVRLWDLATGHELAVLKGHEDDVEAVAFSPDGTRLVSASDDNSLRLWDAFTGKELSVLHGHEDDVEAVAFSPDGTRLASGSEDGTVRIWDSSSGEEVGVFRGHEGKVEAVAFSPDGTRVASGESGADGNTVRLWDTRTGEALAVFRTHQDSVRSLAFSPDGTRLAAGLASLRLWEGSIRFWNAVPYRVLHQERQAILAARPKAERIVDDLWQKFSDWKSVAERLHADATLSEPHRRAALNLALSRSAQIHDHIRDLYLRLIFTKDVITALEADDSLTPAMRRSAVASARARGDQPFGLMGLSWNRVRFPGGDPASYEAALRGAEAALVTEPDNYYYLHTLAVAQYRLERYEEAYATLTRSEEARRKLHLPFTPYEAAYGAMMLFKLGRIDESQAMFARLEDLMSNKSLREHKEMSAFFNEARQLLGVSDEQTGMPKGTDGEK